MKELEGMGGAGARVSRPPLSSVLGSSSHLRTSASPPGAPRPFHWCAYCTSTSRPTRDPWLSPIHRRPWGTPTASSPFRHGSSTSPPTTHQWPPPTRAASPPSPPFLRWRSAVGTRVPRIWGDCRPRPHFCPWSRTGPGAAPVADMRSAGHDGVHL